MKHDDQVRLIRRVLDNMANNSFDMGDGGELAVERYIDPDRLARERTILFRRFPILVGFSSQLRAPGDWLLHRLTGIPILVVRQTDGGIRAFVNTCRHRGVELVDAPNGHARRAFVCPYHAWTYGLDGALLSVTHPDGFPDLDRSCHGLTRLPAAEGHGMIFVRPSPSDTFELDDWLGQIATDFDSFGFADHVLYAPTAFDKAIDWKLFFDTSLEGYHFRHAHRDTIAAMFLDNQAVWEWLPPWHSRNFLPKREVVELADRPEAGWNIRTAGNLLYTIFPNTIVLVQPDHAAVMQTFPTDGVGHSTVFWGTLVPEAPATDKAKAHWDANLKLFIDAIEEDYAMAESIQRGLDTGGNSHLTFGRYEHQVLTFHDTVDRALAEAE